MRTYSSVFSLNWTVLVTVRMVQLHILFTSKNLLFASMWNGLTSKAAFPLRCCSWLADILQHQQAWIFSVQQCETREWERRKGSETEGVDPPSATDTFQEPVMLPLETVMLIPVRSPAKLSSFWKTWMHRLLRSTGLCLSPAWTEEYIFLP